MKYLLPFFFLCLFACEKDGPFLAPGCPSDSHPYAFGRTLPLPDGSGLRIDEVRSYFCPCDVVCVYAGDCDVVLTDDAGFRDTLRVSSIARRDLPGRDTLRGARIEYGGYVISLAGVTTFEECNQEPENYCFSFNVE